MIAFLGVLFLAVLANAQPEQCATPDVWAARQMTLDPSRGFAVFAEINYDALNERVSIVEEIIEEIKDKEKKMFYEEILLHQEKIMYKIELSTNKTRGKCVKEKLDEPFHKFEIPKNATFFDEATIGSNAEAESGVNVKFFGGDVGDDRYYVTVTEKDCIPVHEIFVSKKYGVMHTSFYNVLRGVDPEKFIPPDDCN